MADPRIMRVGIEVEGQIRVFEGLNIEAQGTKFASVTQNETVIKITNLDKDTRDFIGSEGTPFNRRSGRRRQRIYVDAGRESYGYSRVFSGDITTVTQSQPPDITSEIRTLSTQFLKGAVFTYSGMDQTMVSEIARAAASELGLNLVFEATDKEIQSFTYSGPATKILDKIQAFGGLDVYVDDDDLVVKNRNAPINRQEITVSSRSRDLIGTPVFNDFGITFTTLFRPDIELGMAVNLVSEKYPATSGRYVIYKLNFHLANRTMPFYYHVEARRATSGE